MTQAQAAVVDEAGAANRLRLAGDKVDFAAVRLDVVDNDVPVFSPPLGAIIYLLPAKKGSRIGGSVCNAPGKIHR